MTYSDFVTAVKVDLPVDAQRLNIATGTPSFLDHQILYALIDIQKFVGFYRGWHETNYGPDDLTIEGLASVGSLPDDCRPQEAYYRKIGKQCVSQPLMQYPWSDRQDLVCGNPRIVNCQFLMAIDKQGLHFVVFPRVETERQISLYWEGVKLEFQDTDDTPFDKDVAEAVGLFVKSRIALMVDHDTIEYQLYGGQYTAKKRLLWSDTQNRSRLAVVGRSASPASRCSSSVTVCSSSGVALVTDKEHEDTVEFCAFGDSSDANQSNTLAVSNLVKALEPDFIVHLGDSNYPNGDPVTLQDNLVKFYGSYIPEHFYLAWGNHDVATDGGAAEAALLSVQTALNSGKHYYDFIPDEDETGGKVHVFVLDSNDPNGLTAGSEQAVWLQAKLAVSDLWNVVVFHQAAYTSDLAHYPGNLAMREPALKTWGADVVLSGHAHNYERLLVDGLPYIVCGLGGAPKRDFVATPVAGSQFRYNSFYGSLWVTATDEQLQVSFFNTKGDEIDSLLIEAPTV